LCWVCPMFIITGAVPQNPVSATQNDGNHSKHTPWTKGLSPCAGYLEAKIRLMEKRLNSLAKAEFWKRAVSIHPLSRSYALTFAYTLPQTAHRPALRDLPRPCPSCEGRRWNKSGRRMPSSGGGLWCPRHSTPLPRTVLLHGSQACQEALVADAKKRLGAAGDTLGPQSAPGTNGADRWVRPALKGRLGGREPTG
jgi:hypothetical protein